MEHFLGQFEYVDPFFSFFNYYIRVNYNDSNDGFVVYYWQVIEQYQAGEAGEILPSSANRDTIEENIYSSYQFCQGLDLARFKSSRVFPFFIKEITPNHYSCNLSVCDLVINSNPTVTPASAQFVEDGSIQVSGSSSSLPIEYSLTPGFVYGFGITSGLFDNLMSGDYTIYAKDGNGCQTSINVNIPIVSGYGLKHFAEYDDFNGDTTTINIYKKQYIGSSSESTAGGTPVRILTGKRGEVKHYPIKGSEARISLISDTNFKFLEFYTLGSLDFRVDILKEGDLFWRGFIVPEQYNEPYRQPPYPIDISATDGLGDLKEFDFGYDTYAPNPFNPSQIIKTFNKYSGRMRHIDVIVICLNKIGLDLPIYTAVGIFEDDMPTTDPYDPLYYIYVDADNYYPDNVPLNCYDVLAEQLKPYGARIYQAEGAWNIVKFDQQNGEYDKYKYSKDGVYLSKEVFQPIINLTSPVVSDENIWIHDNMGMEIQPGYKYQAAQHDLGYIENLIKGGDFKYTDFYEDTGELKYFTYHNFYYLNPIFYDRIALEPVSADSLEVNHGIGMGGWNHLPIIKIKTVGDVNVTLSGSQAIGGLQVYEGDVVLLFGQFDQAKNGIWVVKNGAWERDERFNSSSKIVGYSTFGKFIISFGNYAGRIYRFLVSFFSFTLETSPINFAETIMSEYSYIKSMPVNLEYDNNDQFLIKIKRRFRNASTVKFYLGVEVLFNNKYLADDLTYKSTYNFIEIELDNINKFTEDEILSSIGFDSGTGDFTIKLFWYSKDILVEGSNSLVIDSLKLIYQPDGFDPIKTKEYLLNNSNRYRYSPEDIMVLHGDAPDVLNKSKIYSTYLTLPNGTLTKNWHRKDYAESKNLLKLLLESIISNYLTSNELITGTINRYLTLNNVIFDPNNSERIFMIGSVEYNDRLLRSDVELMEITLNEQVSSFSSAFTIGFGGGFD